MFIFKILLIILIAAPVIALGTYFYLQILNFIKEKNKLEQEAIFSGLEESGKGSGKGKKNSGKKSGKKSKKDSKGKKSRKNSKNGENGQQK